MSCERLPPKALISPQELVVPTRTWAQLRYSKLLALYISKTLNPKPLVNGGTFETFGISSISENLNFLGPGC